ncbi:MAG: capsule assembly Wzi family protein [Cyclobacteriaceae bacterium]
MSIKPIAISSTLNDSLQRSIFKSKNKKYLFSTVPMEFKYEYNSRNPHPAYNGSMLPSKGSQLILAPGIGVTAPFLEAQFQPEIFYTENLGYPGFPQMTEEALKTWPNSKRWSSMYRWYNQIDLPESFGSQSSTTVLPGQSFVKAKYRNISVGVSTQNLWWGPGKYNSLVLSNNARGFMHFSLETDSPLILPFGSIEFQLISGKLINSGFLPPDTAQVNRGSKLYQPKPELDRYLNGLTIVYQPHWVSGLYLGVNAAIQQYSETANFYNDYMPVLTDPIGFGKHRKDTLIRQQISSVFFRWVWPLSEIYFEYGRNNASWKLKQLRINPQLDAAYIFGFTKLVPLKKTNTFLEFNIELTQLQQPADVQIAQGTPRSWYIHPTIRQGYTNYGEVLGSRAGPGGNIQILEVSRVHNLNKLGFYFERFVHNNDFVYLTFNGSMGGDFRNYWVDYLFGLQSNLSINRFIVNSKLSYIRSLNYQWEIVPGEPYFGKGSGIDTNNFNFSCNVSYLF